MKPALMSPGATHSDRRRILAIICFGMLFLFGVWSHALAQPPANDAFGNSAPILGYEAHITTSNRGATNETGEPRHDRQTGSSVWWRWTPPEDGVAVLDTTGTRFENLLAVYWGKVISALNPEQALDSSTTNAPASRFVFDARPQRDYVIAVDGKNGASGELSLNLKLYTAPVLFIQPLSQNVTDGENVIFDVSAIGRRELKYQWFDDTGPLSGQTDRTLTLRAVSKSSEGRYWVIVSNSVASVTSSVANLGVLRRPKIVQQPVGGHLIAGNDFTFRVQAIGEAPLDYQWLRDGVDVPRATGPVLSLGNVSTEEQGDYQVRVQNAVDSTISNVARLDVAPGPPIISRPPTNQVVVEGATVFLTVGAEGYKPLRYQWRHDDFAPPEATNSVLRLSNVTTNESGVYRVLVANRYGDRQTPDARLTVEVRPSNDMFSNRIRIGGFGTPVIGYNKHATREPNENPHFRPTATNSVWWGFSPTNRGIVTVDLSGTDFDWAVAVYEGTSLDRLNPVASNGISRGGSAGSAQFLAEAGREYVIAVAGMDGQFGIIKLQLSIDPEIKLPQFDPTAGPFDLMLLGEGKGEGHSGGGGEAGGIVGSDGCRSGQLTSRTISVAPVTYRWQYNGADLRDQTNANLNLRNVVVSMSGEYRVIACNAAGCTNSPSVHLTVNPLPLIKVQPQSMTVRECSDARLEVDADGGCSSFQTQWYHGDRLLTGRTNLIFSFTNADPTQAGPYFAVMRNSYGAVTSVVAEVKIDSKPAIASGPKAPAEGVPECSDVKLEVRLVEDLKCRASRIQWFLGTNAIPGATNAEYTLQATLEAAGDYFVQVYNQVATTDSATTKLTVKSELKIVENPAKQRVLAGTTFTNRVQVLTCSDAKFLWRRDGQPVIYDATHERLINGMLVVKNARPSDTGQYDVVIQSKEVTTNSSKAFVEVLFAPPNDNFADRNTLSGIEVSTNGSNILATGEPGEGSHAGQLASHSVWWTWMSPVPSLVTVDLTGSSFDTLLGIYNGASLNNLTLIAEDDQGGSEGTSKVSFLAARNRHFEIAVDGGNSAEGTIQLHLTAVEIKSRPIITNEPQSVAALPGDRVQFSVAASGSPDIAYQWYSNGNGVADATNAVYVIPKVSPELQGKYTVQLTNEYGFTESQIAQLTFGTIIGGLVTDATTGRGIAGVTVSVGTNSTTTGADGKYTLVGVLPGSVRADFDVNKRRVRIGETVRFKNLSTLKSVILHAEKTNFFDYSDYSVEVPQGRTISNSFSMSPKIGGIRLVANWGLQPADLDAHLFTPAIDGNIYHINYQDTYRNRPDAPPYATLDYDVSTSYGPETITLSRVEEGTYRYFLQKYNADAVGSLAGSEAVVKLYTATGLFGTRKVPTGGTESVWHVCDIDGLTGVVTWVDQLLVQPPPLPAGVLSEETSQGFHAGARVRQGRPAGTDFGGNRFRWDFGDGTSTNLVEPRPRYTRPGFYDVRLALLSDPNSEEPTAVELKQMFIWVTNTPPTVQLKMPDEGEIFRAGDEIELEADANDADGRVVRVEFFAVRDGVTNRIAELSAPPYRTKYRQADEGKVRFLARAHDDFDGFADSPSVSVVIRDLSGDVLIVRNAPGPEIIAMESYLEALDIPDDRGNPGPTVVVRVLDQEGLRFDLVKGFKLIIWDDLGGVESGLTDNDVRVLDQAYYFGIPLYLIGERLGSSKDNLTATNRVIWENLTGLGEVTGFIDSPDVVRAQPTDLTHELFDNSFGSVADFSYPGRIEMAPAVGLTDQVRATALDTPVILRFPKTNELLGASARKIVQNFLVAAGSQSLEDRRVLFLNSCRWLLGFDCTYFDAFLTCPLGMTEANVGEVMTLTLKIAASGHCTPEGIVLTNLLPVGFDLVQVRTESTPEGANEARWLKEAQMVTVRVGEMALGSQIQIRLDLLPKVAGDFEILSSRSAVGLPPDLCRNSVRVHPHDCLPVELAIQWKADASLRLVWRGTLGCNAVLQRSVDLIHWEDLFQSRVSDTFTDALTLGEVNSLQFYRARIVR